MPEKVVKDLKNIYSLGKEKYYQFMEKRFKSNSKSTGDTIPRNNLGMFSKPGTETKAAGRLTKLKNDMALFSRLYTASQTREGDVDEFFQHENQCTPPSLATGGQMCQGDKHNRLDCLEGNVTNSHGTSLDVDCKVLDGPAVVHFLVPVTCGTFEDYAKEIFLPCGEGTGHSQSNQYCMGWVQVRQLEKRNERKERLWNSASGFILHKNSRQLAWLSSKQ